jgi:hypothetical protein
MQQGTASEKGRLPGAFLAVCATDAHSDAANALQSGGVAVAGGSHLRLVIRQLRLAHDERVAQRIRCIARLQPYDDKIIMSNYYDPLLYTTMLTPPERMSQSATDSRRSPKASNHSNP